MPTSPSRLRRWLLGAAGWTAVAVLFALPEFGPGGNPTRGLQMALAQWWAWGLLAVLITAVDRRLPTDADRLGVRLAVHVPLSIVFTIGYLYLSMVLGVVLGLRPTSDIGAVAPLLRSLRGMFFWSWPTYWVIVGGWLAFGYHARLHASEVQLADTRRLSTEARLHALRLQLDPHFLFNALNTISAQLERDPRAARQMIEHLGDLLRVSLDGGARHLVPLADDLAFLEHYLAIQRIRFGDRIRVTTDVPDDVASGLVPSLLVQPLVENAIRHGLSPRASGGTVRVSARRVGAALHLDVEDDGVGLAAAHGHGGGLGLSITRQRLQGLYPDGDARLDVEDRPGGGTVAHVIVPFRTSLETSFETSGGVCV